MVIPRRALRARESSAKKVISNKIFTVAVNYYYYYYYYWIKAANLWYSKPFFSSFHWLSGILECFTRIQFLTLWKKARSHRIYQAGNGASIVPVLVKIIHRKGPRNFHFAPCKERLFWSNIFNIVIVIIYLSQTNLVIWELTSILNRRPVRDFLS